MESITPKITAIAPAPGLDLQRPVQSNSAIQSGDSDPSQNTFADNSDLPDAIVLGAGVPTLDFMTRRWQQQIEQEQKKADERAEENAQLERHDEQERSDRAALDAQLAAHGSPDQKPLELHAGQASPGSNSGATPVEAVPGSSRDKVSAVPAGELLNRVMVGLHHLDTKQLSSIHRLNLSVKA